MLGEWGDVRFALGLGARLAREQPAVEDDVRHNAVVPQHADAMRRVRDVPRRRPPEREIRRARVRAAVQPHVRIDTERLAPVLLDVRLDLQVLEQGEQPGNAHRAARCKGALHCHVISGSCLFAATKMKLVR